MSSIRVRLILANLILLPFFLGVTGWYLENSYRSSVHLAAQERMQAQLLTLLAEADYDQDLIMPSELLEPRFNQLNSGLHAVVLGGTGVELWRSGSSIELDDALTGSGVANLSAGEKRFSVGDQYYSFSWSVVWQTEAGREVPLVFKVLEALDPARAQLDAFRDSLFLWFGGAAIGLLLGQLLVLYWGLRPLGELAEGIAAIESGERDALSGPYPSEVKSLAANLNSLLFSESHRRERMRNTLADLAHSLKTPLAVVRSSNPETEDYSATVSEQVGLMEETVNYHLQRASTGSHNLLRLVPVFPQIDRLLGSMRKVYADKGIQFDVRVSQEAHFKGDDRDFLEMVGNVLDNACKYCSSKVSISALVEGQSLKLIIEDDGQGIPKTIRNAILERGVRADTTRAGQGIGLAVAADIAAAYEGTIAIGNSALGGARIEISF